MTKMALCDTPLRMTIDNFAFKTPKSIIMNFIRNVMAAMLLACGITVASAADDWANINRYDSNNTTLKAQANTGTRVVFLGNSITDFWVSTHPSFFTDNDFIGRGIAGQTTYQFLVRFREDIVELAPAAVVINGGTNDIAENNYAYNEDRTFGNIASMAEIASANGIKVILASVLPASGFNWNTSISGVADKIASLNARIKAYAESKSYPYIDYYPALVSGSDRALNPAYTNDGVHPTAAGYDIMESIALPVIRSVVKLDANLPETASISGAALAESETVGLHRRGIGSFEAYTKLRGGETFTIEADGKKYGRTDGYMTEGGTISVDKTGVYRVRANFVSRIVSLEQVDGIGLFYCITNDRKIELTYAGNGVFKGYGDITLLNLGWGYDTRYRLAMDLDGYVQWWGPINDNEDGEPRDNEEYFYMKETNPANQWDNKWKFDISKADADHVLKGIEITVDLNGDQYTHAMAYGIEAPAQTIPATLTAQGEGLAEGPSLAMTKIDGSTFELFTRLNAGKTFEITDGTDSYVSVRGELAEGTGNAVEKDGIYCININFAKGTFDIDEVTKMTVYCCWFGGDLNQGCEYKGNGVWEQTAYWAIDDFRYKFRMDVGGKSQFWGPVNTEEDGTPNGTQEYFDMVRSTPASQWDNKWKVDPSLKNHNVKWTVSLNSDKYTHTQADADIASGVAEVTVDTAGEYEYFSVQGVRLASRPESGIYIRRKNGISEKIVIK